MPSEEYKNNPLYYDITNLDHLSPQPTFNYEWNIASGRWEPAGPIKVDNLNLSGDFNVDFGPTNEILSGILSKNSDIFDLISGVTNPLIKSISGISGGSVDIDLDETNKILSGISGELSNIHVDVEIDSDTKTHELLSGISGELADLNIDIDGDTIPRSAFQPWKLRTKTVNQKIEEDFILMENIPEDIRYGITSGKCFGEDKNLMDDVFGTYFRNGRTNISEPETGHPDYFIHAEYTDPDRCIDSYATFHSDTLFGLRQENVTASLINSYELQDYNNLYERGLVDHVVIYNESSYPLQFHTADRRLDKSEPVSPKNDDLIYLDTDIAVKIDNDEAGRIFVKRPHTISGYTVKYSVVYKETGVYDVIE